ncbi:glycoside hydrolase family 64 protein [Xylariaceae sp. FL0662B]|nr:glycoside hydrolase family 64 protein [Xylariaceae sp. FL0662B]
MTPSTTQIALKNNTGSSNAYAYITGLDLNNNNVPLFIQADGQTVYHPSSPSEPQQALETDVAISLQAPGTTTTVTIPQIAGGRIWFSIDSKLTFLLNPGPSVVEPSVTNTADANYNLNWGFCEFTYNSFQLFVNISYVDFVSLPVALELRNTAGNVQTVQGLPADGLDTVCTKLAQQGASDGAGWDKLVVKSADGSKNLRALSPNSGRVADASLFDGYYQSYVDAVWQKYAGADLTINTQASWGTVTGRVQSGDLLTFDGIGTFAKPAAADIFSCSTGPFGSYPDDGNRDAMGALGARIAAALNRSTLLANPDQPDGEKVASYYTTSPTNHYARICHETNLDNRGYAFPYDDVVASGDTEPDQAGTVFDENPELLTVTIGGPATNSAAAAAAANPQAQKVVAGGKEEKNKKESKGAAPALGKRTLRGWLSTLKRRLTK